MKPSPTRVASVWSSRQGSRTIWRGMQLKLHPGAVSAAKKLTALDSKMNELFLWQNTEHTYQEFIQTTPEIKKLHDRIEKHKSALLKAVLDSFRGGHVGIHWSLRKSVAKSFALKGDPGKRGLSPASITETYVLLEGIDPGVGVEQTGIFWDEAEVTIPRGTPIKLQNIWFWGSDLGTALEDATHSFSFSTLTVKA